MLTLTNSSALYDRAVALVSFTHSDKMAKKTYSCLENICSCQADLLSLENINGLVFVLSPYFYE